MVLASRLVSGLNFIEVMIAIVLAWIITSMWFRVIDNIAYSSVGLNPKSTLHSFIAALVVTVILIAFTFSVRSNVTDMIVGDTFGTVSETSSEQTEQNNSENTNSTRNISHSKILQNAKSFYFRNGELYYEDNYLSGKQLRGKGSILKHSYRKAKECPDYIEGENIDNLTYDKIPITINVGHGRRKRKTQTSRYN